MKVFITKYALTLGIEEVEASLYAEGRAVSYGQYGSAHGEGTNWHKTMEGAKKRAEEMRVNKIASLRNRIAKLEKLSFQ